MPSAALPMARLYQDRDGFSHTIIFSCVSWFKYSQTSCPFVSIRGSSIPSFRFFVCFVCFVVQVFPDFVSIRVHSCPFVVQIFPVFVCFVCFVCFVVQIFPVFVFPRGPDPRDFVKNRASGETELSSLNILNRQWTQEGFQAKQQPCNKDKFAMVNECIAKFMESFPHEALTFNDVSLEVYYADFLPGEASTASQFSRNISVNLPFISAAMDTVTEHQMAIAMAKLGGLGVIHKNLPPQRDVIEGQRLVGK